VPNARVREFAKEVVEVMFNATPVQNNPNTLAAQVGVSSVCHTAQHSAAQHGNSRALQELSLHSLQADQAATSHTVLTSITSSNEAPGVQLQHTHGWHQCTIMLCCPPLPLTLVATLPSCLYFMSQGKIQGFGSENSSGHYSGGFNSSGSGSGPYGGMSSSSGMGGSYSGSGPSRSGGIGSNIPTSFAEAQRAASQLTQVGLTVVWQGVCWP
jgi:hypothetical protein